MLYDDETLNFLKGNGISNSHWVTIPNQKLISRNELLKKISANKKILHIGCADHPELIEKKRESGNYLHDLLTDIAEQVVGCDVNQSALQKMTDLGIKDLYTPENIPDIKFDLVLIPDVIEHLPNVNDFLLSLRKYRADKIVITTPNAYRLQNRSLWRKELVNTDHRYWFSPYTLSKSVIAAGYEIEDIYYTDTYGNNIFKNIKKHLFPLSRDGLAIIIK